MTTAIHRHQLCYSLKAKGEQHLDVLFHSSGMLPDKGLKVFNITAATAISTTRKSEHVLGTRFPVLDPHYERHNLQTCFSFAVCNGHNVAILITAVKAVISGWLFILEDPKYLDDMSHVSPPTAGMQKGLMGKRVSLVGNSRRGKQG